MTLSFRTILQLLAPHVRNRDIHTTPLESQPCHLEKNRAIFSLENGRLIWYLELKSGTGKSRFKKPQFVFLLNRTMFDLRFM